MEIKREMTSVWVICTVMCVRVCGGGGVGFGFGVGALGGHAGSQLWRNDDSS